MNRFLFTCLSTLKNLFVLTKKICEHVTLEKKVRELALACFKEKMRALGIKNGAYDIALVK